MGVYILCLWTAATLAFNFFEAFTTLKDRYETIPVGFVREDEVIINPEKRIRFEKNDEILYIAKKKIGLATISGSSVKLPK